jgi:hypothetical protein
MELRPQHSRKILQTAAGRRGASRDSGTGGRPVLLAPPAFIGSPGSGAPGSIRTSNLQIRSQIRPRFMLARSSQNVAIPRHERPTSVTDVTSDQEIGYPAAIQGPLFLFLERILSDVHFGPSVTLCTSARVGRTGQELRELSPSSVVSTYQLIANATTFPASLNQFPLMRTLE